MDAVARIKGQAVRLKFKKCSVCLRDTEFCGNIDTVVDVSAKGVMKSLVDGLRFRVAGESELYDVVGYLDEGDQLAITFSSMRVRESHRLPMSVEVLYYDNPPQPAPKPGLIARLFGGSGDISPAPVAAPPERLGTLDCEEGDGEGNPV